VAQTGAPNAGLTDLALRPLPNGDLRVVARARNWSDAHLQDAPVALVIDGEEAARTTVSVRPWSATQVSFPLPNPGNRTLAGHVQLETSDLADDNRRYFTWNAPRRVPVAIVAGDPGDVRWPAQRFLAEAIPAESDLPWTAEILRPAELAERLDNPVNRPEMILVADAADAPDAFWTTLREYVRAGGPALLIASAETSADVVNAELLGATALRLGEPIPLKDRRRPESMTWVDLDHPVFI